MEAHMVSTLLGISAGAALGALSRWGLTLLLNALFPPLALGTLAANLIGCFLMGMILGAGTALPQWDPTWRTPVVTGFLGALTTFSSFAAEVVLLMEQGRPIWAALNIVAHLGGCLLMVFAGMACAGLLRRMTA